MKIKVLFLFSLPCAFNHGDSIMYDYRPKYLRAYSEGRLNIVKLELSEALSNCKLCPRKCGVDRLKNETGICKTGHLAVIASVSPHFGEEPPLVGTRGSGTIFFTHCNLLCNFCQNFDISHEGMGREISSGELANHMLHLQLMGCHNINFVTPSHVVPQIISALEIAVEKGLKIPIVFNSGGYDSVETLKMIDGIIDIYMPDFKFWHPDSAGKTSDAPDYPEVARKAILEMHRQVGKLEMNEKGIAIKGLLIRHLVMPEGLAESEKILSFISRKIAAETYVNVMPQYRPSGHSSETPELDRPLYQKEYDEAIALAGHAGLMNIF